MNNRFFRLAPAVALCLPLLAFAQGQAAEPRRADPTDAKASAPQLRYQSAFADYKAWQDAKPGDWRALNDNLSSQSAGAGHGGHAGHAMPSAASAPSPSASKPMSGHGAHQMHGGKQ